MGTKTRGHASAARDADPLDVVEVIPHLVRAVGDAATELIASYCDSYSL